jgi:hypothetical protein
MFIRVWMNAAAQPGKSRDECEALMRAELGWHRRTMLYLFGVRAWPPPAGYYRGRSVPNRRLARLRGQPRQTPVALRSARESRAWGELAAFPRCLRRLSAVMPYHVHAEKSGYFLIRRELRAAWMGRYPIGMRP